MTIPDWVYLIVSALCLLGVAIIQARVALDKADNFRAVEAERIARRNTAPLGNASRWWGE